jgi:aerobic carbon-monoxide dehydrogenase medium subunit
MRRFEYYEPSTLDEAVSLLDKFGNRGNLFAGGTDLLVEIREHIRCPDHIINIKKISGLDRLSYDEEHGLRCGALVTIRMLESSSVVQRHYRGIADAARELGSVQVRNRATLGGNVCRASPSADMLSPLIADAATVTVHGPNGTRVIALEDFFTGPGKTVLQPNEVLIEFQIPAPKPRTGKIYLKHGRRKAMELATVGVAVAATIADSTFRDVRIVLGAVAPTPIRSHRAEAVLIGQTVSTELLEAAAEAAMEEARPITDVRASAEYRRKMVGVLTRRALLGSIEATR